VSRDDGAEGVTPSPLLPTSIRDLTKLEIAFSVAFGHLVRAAREAGRPIGTGSRNPTDTIRKASVSNSLADQAD
jgi:hypothetical protein